MNDVCSECELVEGCMTISRALLDTYFFELKEIPRFTNMHRTLIIQNLKRNDQILVLGFSKIQVLKWELNL